MRVTVEPSLGERNTAGSFWLEGGFKPTDDKIKSQENRVFQASERK